MYASSALKEWVGGGWERVALAGVSRGVHPAWFGYRSVLHESVQQYFARHAVGSERSRYETVHPETVAHNPLPRNVPSRDVLPADRGWWGYSFRDVPERTSGETFIATIPDCQVVYYRDPSRGHDFYPAVVAGDGRALDLREMRFRPLHAETLRRGARPERLDRATWVLERSYHNYSHWLTAHLPKFLLLRERGGLQDVLLPPKMARALTDSLRRLGFFPERFRTFDEMVPLRVQSLTLVGSDRFRPELLRLVPDAYGVASAARPWRRVLISRAGAARRRLLNEEEVWRVLEPAGFERVRMEGLSFDEQMELMRETAVLLAPHGAGLTNMMLCPPGAQIVEIADSSFPNPNFYALAVAMRHDYWLVPGESLGDCHPLEKDLRVLPDRIRQLLPRLAPGH